jgi:hypothetical protein
MKRFLRFMTFGLPIAGLAAMLVIRPFGLARSLPSIPKLGNFGLLSESPHVSDGCDPNKPSFLYGFAAMKAQLGGTMGDPLECEHSIYVGGDTRQQTTTGYAYYRPSVNVPAFTNGTDHWALTDAGLVHWIGDVVDPPTA